MSMDGALHHLCTSFSSLTISSRLFQIDNLAPSHSASGHGSIRPKNVRLPGALIVGPLCAVRDDCGLFCTRKPAKRQFAKDANWACSTRDRNVSDNSDQKFAFRVGCLRKDLPFQREEYANLEFEVLKFMESSDKPFSFPSKSELLEAGRADLVDAIIAKGGWLVAGWDSEPENNEKVQRLGASRMGTNAQRIQSQLVEAPKLSTGENSTLAPSVAYQNTSVRSASSKKRKGRCKLSRNGTSGVSSPTTERFQQEQEDLVLSKLGTESQGGPSLTELSGATDRMVGWKKVAKLFGLAEYSRKPEHGRRTVDLDGHASLEGGAYSSFAIPNGNASMAAGRSSIDLSDDLTPSSPVRTDIQPTGQRQTSDSVSWRKSGKKKKKRRKSFEDRGADFNLSQAFDRISERVNRRNDWILKVKSSSQERCSGLCQENNPAPIASRIRGLESKLTATLNMLQSGRRALAHDETLQQTALAEFESASDALEFRETELMRARRELRSTRAQLTALEGKLALELIEARKGFEEKSKKLDETMNVLKRMCTVRVVWPNPASEVLLTGSFDGWTSRIMLQKSSAGVFVTSLQLYPGRYEIKFIVDGEWKVDPNRPVTRADGFENNVLTVI